MDEMVSYSRHKTHYIHTPANAHTHAHAQIQVGPRPTQKPCHHQSANLKKIQRYNCMTDFRKSWSNEIPCTEPITIMKQQYSAEEVEKKMGAIFSFQLQYTNGVLAKVTIGMKRSHCIPCVSAVYRVNVNEGVRQRSHDR